MREVRELRMVKSNPMKLTVFISEGLQPGRFAVITPGEIWVGTVDARSWSHFESELVGAGLTVRSPLYPERSSGSPARWRGEPSDETPAPVRGRNVIIGPGPRAMARAEYAWRLYLEATEQDRAGQSPALPSAPAASTPGRARTSGGKRQRQARA
jgi:hypothetical protein